MKTNLATYPSDPKADSGLTLIEMIIAVIVAGVVALGVGTQIYTTIQFSQLPRQQSQALQLAQERLEEVLFTDRKSGYDAVIAANFPDEVPVLGFDEYDRLVTIAESAACTGGSTCKEITVTIRVNSNYDTDQPTVMVNTIKEQVFKH